MQIATLKGLVSGLVLSQQQALAQIQELKDKNSDLVSQLDALRANLTASTASTRQTDTQQNTRADVQQSQIDALQSMFAELLAQYTGAARPPPQPSPRPPTAMLLAPPLGVGRRMASEGGAELGSRPKQL